MTNLQHENPITKSSANPPIIFALCETLVQLAEMIQSLSDKIYLCTIDNGASGHIGGHVRHSLDHARSILQAAHTGKLDYDARKRGTTIEKSREQAMTAIHQINHELSQLTCQDLRQLISLKVIYNGEGSQMDCQSTLEREAAFVLSHTIHHNAIIAAIIRHTGGQVPKYFGFAPSTIHYLSQSCVPSV